MKAWIKRLIGSEEISTPKPRKYQVPEGWFADRITELHDNYRLHKRAQTSRALWKLLEERCPEVRQGRWRVSFIGSAVFIEEVIA